ncbi:hypothetical protein FY034_06865 [Trichlorobacter lovleyi]|uniref:hypothetical protein n=1 Tax=Trichlorobacter lovleyi TaxID=313985 RepID=UPI00223EA921|nr:hypothetical protein [Trichlorobacter lovleyi]QOX78656.1 hypothetical protein FY034_06865 [Trichlorobacter lovleyi]
MFDHILNIGVQGVLAIANGATALFGGTPDVPPKPFEKGEWKCRRFCTDIQKITIDKGKCSLTVGSNEYNGECTIAENVITIKDKDKEYKWKIGGDGLMLVELYDEEKKQWVKMYP